MSRAHRFATGLSSSGSSLLRSLAASRFNPLRVRHVHVWHDWYVFDSSARTTTGPRPDFRVIGQQIMMLCVCGETKRKHLPTWRDARLARKRLPYKRWGVWNFSLPVPDAIAMETRRAIDSEAGVVAKR